MQEQAILHIPLSKDAYALKEDELVIRLRTAKNDMKKCILYYGDRVCMTEPIEVEAVTMEKIGADRLFDYYEAVIHSKYTRICYYFHLFSVDGKTIFYSEYGFSDSSKIHRTQFFQFPYIRKEDMIEAPAWTKGMVMYHIFPDSFASDKEYISGQGAELEIDGKKSRSKNGGTLRGIIDNLDYLEGMNINCIYLNPIFQAASYHKYDTIDYYEVDACLGSKEDLRELVQQCHQRDIRVILDGVFNHCGSGFFAFQDVLENGEQSKYKDWFYRLNFPIQYMDPPNYEAFAYVKEMPKLNTGNPEVVKYFCEVGTYWIRELDIDGWRLDVANEINHDFWRSFRSAVKKEKKDAFLIGEIWEDSSEWLRGDQFDSTMNYSFSYVCREFFAEQSIGITEFDEKINHINLRYPEQVTQMQMNFLDTHDVPRFLSYCDGDIDRFKLAMFYMMSAQGIPSIFYGDEKGIMGTTEATYRSPMPWGKEENKELQQYVRNLVAMRRNSEALQKGNYRTVLIEEEKKLYVFSRTYHDKKALVIMNMGDLEQTITKGEIPSLMKETIVCPPKSGRIV